VDRREGLHRVPHLIPWEFCGCHAELRWVKK
jgi:hypothetical protein